MLSKSGHSAQNPALPVAASFYPAQTNAWEATEMQRPSELFVLQPFGFGHLPPLAW
jgi:hypothetical protein